METLGKLLEQYKKIDYTLSIEEERALIYNYIYSTNKLEGNQLSLVQTTQLLSSDTLSGNGIRTTDILEQKGMHKALLRMLKAVREKEVLSIGLILEINWLVLGYLWKYDDAYLDAKSKGQKVGDFKISANKIEIRKAGEVIEVINPLSSPQSVEDDMKKLINTINASSKSSLEKAVFIAQEIWLHQPFVDGNKRTGRLLINFLLMQDGYPLFSFDTENNNYNSLLVTQYIEHKEKLVLDYIINKLKTQITLYLQTKKNIKKGTGFRMML